MPAIAIPNVSEGRDERVLDVLSSAISGAGGVVVDTHSDGIHNRTVFTVTSHRPSQLPRAMAALARAAAEEIDLVRHCGIHPRVGCLDVCPFVPAAADDTMAEAVEIAHEAGHLIAAVGLPVFFYAHASKGPVRSLRTCGAEGCAV